MTECTYKSVCPGLEILESGGNFSDDFSTPGRICKKKVTDQVKANLEIYRCSDLHGSYVKCPLANMIKKYEERVQRLGENNKEIEKELYAARRENWFLNSASEQCPW
jgi:hypothetical protein